MSDEKPAFAIHWDNESQSARFEIDPAKIKNVAMAIAVMEMCVDSLKFQNELQRAAQFQAQQQQAMLGTAIKNKLRL